MKTGEQEKIQAEALFSEHLERFNSTSSEKSLYLSSSIEKSIFTYIFFLFVTLQEQHF